jgi:hypothetical protein
MRVVPFPSADERGPEEAWLAELEAALEGTSEGPAAEAWRELRSDVRSLPAPISTEFEQELHERIVRPREQRRRIPRVRLAGWGRWLDGHRPLVGALASCVAALLVVGFVVKPWDRGSVVAVPMGRPIGVRADSAPFAQAKAASSPATSASAVSGAAVPAPGESVASGREQQRAASITLAATSSEVQSVADGAARVAARLGGFVESSQVQVSRGGSSGAQLTLSVPSANLNAALGSLGQLASLRAESQSLQDITDAYDAARRRLADANAERQALLRALSAAVTQGQIDSLRERLSGAAQRISAAHDEVQGLSRRASNSQVEVTVTGTAHASAAGGSTLHRGLHDAGHVLAVTLTALLIGAAVLVPLALLGLVAAVAGGGIRRYRRERALDRL